MGSLGFLGMRHPADYGGGGLGPLVSVVLAEELARSSFGGFASAVTVHTDMSISHIAQRGTDEQKLRYLPAACAGEKVGAVCVAEPGAGSDVAALRTRAVKTSDGWVINGSKTFITNGVLGDIYIVAARTNPDAAGARGISLFIVERGAPGFSVSGKLNKHGWRSSDTAELFFENTLVPHDALLGEEGRGFHAIMSAFQNERLVIGGLVAGASAKAIDSTLDYLAGATRVGMAPDAGVSVTLTQLVGFRRATEILMLNPVLDAAKALEIGLISRVAPDEAVLDEAWSLARTLAAGATAALAHTKRLLWNGLGTGVEAAMPEENQAQEILSATEDAREGLAAVIEKRRPKFTGR
jgi:alkylation response protein AidB-like acyl-CoA dehydrogenase